MMYVGRGGSGKNRKLPERMGALSWMAEGYGVIGLSLSRNEQKNAVQWQLNGMSSK
jgi:hypothetical protein